MKLDEALTKIGGLSNPSKMPWYAWSISAKNCHTGSKLHLIKGAVCEHCYALKGRYVFPNVQNAMKRRLDALNNNPDFEDAFVFALNSLYENGRKTYLYKGKEIKENRFRWHDSGDLQSLRHLEVINNIAKRCPQLKFYLPTKETIILREWNKPFEPNLHVRLSAPMVGAKLNKTVLGVPQSTVGRETDKTVFHCVAPKQGNQCKNCSACWSQTPTVNYHLH